MQNKKKWSYFQACSGRIYGLIEVDKHRTPSDYTLFLEPRECMDACIIGVNQRPTSLIPIINYDYQNCVSALTEWMEVERWEAAAELDLQLNVIFNHPGKPAMVHTGDLDEVQKMLDEWVYSRDY